jgi:hypothetical protein
VVVGKLNLELASVSADNTGLQVWAPYLPIFYGDELAKVTQRPLPYSNKQNAIIYINSNCGAQSGRHAVLTQLDQLLRSSNSSIRIHSYGGCSTHDSHADHGPDAASLAEFRRASSKDRSPTKLKYFGKYKFCVVGEWRETKLWLACTGLV